MDVLTKLRGRKPLAISDTPLSLSAGGGGGGPGGYVRFSIHVKDEATEASYTLQLGRSSARRFVEWYAGCTTFVHGLGKDGMGFTDSRTLPEKLRALADKIERESKHEA